MYRLPAWFRTLATIFLLGLIPGGAMAAYQGADGAAGNAKVALVIGVERYRDEKVPGAINASKAIAGVLISRLKYPPTQVVLMNDSMSEASLKPSVQNLKREVDTFLRKVTRDSEVTVYFAGHGLSAGKPEQGYLLALDGRSAQPSEDGISVALVLKRLREAAPRSLAIFLDTQWNRVGGGKGLKASEEPPPGSAPELIFYACGDKEQTAPLKIGDGDSGTVFAKFLVEALGGAREARADGRAEGDLTFESLGKFVRQRVANYVRDIVGGSQLPNPLWNEIGKTTALDRKVAPVEAPLQQREKFERALKALDEAVVAADWPTAESRAAELLKQDSGVWQAYRARGQARAETRPEDALDQYLEARYWNPRKASVLGPIDALAAKDELAREGGLGAKALEDARASRFDGALRKANLARALQQTDADTALALAFVYLNGPQAQADPMRAIRWFQWSAALDRGREPEIKAGLRKALERMTAPVRVEAKLAADEADELADEAHAGAARADVTFPREGRAEDLARWVLAWIDTQPDPEPHKATQARAAQALGRLLYHRDELDQAIPLLAVAYQKDSNLTDARRMYQELLDRQQKGNAFALSQKALAAAREKPRQRSLDEIEELANRAILLDRGDASTATAFLARAMVRTEQEKWEDALQDCGLALQRDSSLGDAIVLKDEVVKKKGATDLRQGIADASRLVEQGQLELAERKLQALLVEKPEVLEVRLLLAAVLFRRKQLDAAAYQVRRIAAAQSDFPGLAVLRDQVEQEIRKRDVAGFLKDAEQYLSLYDQLQAERKTREALKLEPDNARAHAMLGYALLRLGDKGESARETERALGLQPDVAFAHITRGSLILQLGLETEKQDLLRRAAEEYKLALASEPKNPLALADLGLAQLFLKQMEDAEQSLLAAIDASLALGAAGSRDNAFLAAAQLTLGHVHLSRKAYDKAESAYQRAKQSFEKNPFIHFSLAIALDNQKKKDAARIAARDARRLGLLPEYEGRLRDRGLLAGASPP